MDTRVNITNNKGFSYKEMALHHINEHFFKRLFLMV